MRVRHLRKETRDKEVRHSKEVVQMKELTEVKQSDKVGAILQQMEQNVKMIVSALEARGYSRKELLNILWDGKPPDLTKPVKKHDTH